MAGSGQFVELRPVLFGVAYRMLGSAAEADDIVQEAYLRWAEVDDADIESPRAYLTTIVDTPFDRPLAIRQCQARELQRTLAT